MGNTRMISDYYIQWSPYDISKMTVNSTKAKILQNYPLLIEIYVWKIKELL